ncbi:hypothetical protein RYD26_05330 [Pasteurellaceae bacterium LIM206]|nr:hypothetical protein [Pasteurellaceae bacterium LIM206]
MIDVNLILNIVGKEEAIDAFIHSMPIWSIFSVIAIICSIIIYYKSEDPYNVVFPLLCIGIMSLMFLIPISLDNMDRINIKDYEILYSKISSDMRIKKLDKESLDVLNRCALPEGLKYKQYPSRYKINKCVIETDIKKKKQKEKINFIPFE